ncbi:alpha/beta fold hydrolase [Oxalobacteraceae bacterium OM1]|nr:alpha/beta fold hydrolase [Oxalobacteraceae bacterium OM1]
MDRRTHHPLKPERRASSWLGRERRQDPFYHGTADTLDHALKATLAKLTLNVSPASLWMAWFDWVVHLQLSPSKQQQLLQEVGRKLLQWQFQQLHAAGLPDGEDEFVEPLPQDRRFADLAWEQWPFNVISQGFLLSQQWWHRATTGVEGVSRHHEDVVTFMARQLLDMMSPSNFLLTNPVARRDTLRSGGMNLLQGLANQLNDAERYVTGRPARLQDAFQVGGNLAVTPGKVVFRNRLIELIQYAPTTPDVRAVPVLFVPAWIMKYYILDLSPENSLVRYLVQQGYMVFMVSWLNPCAEDRDLSMEDYRRMGVMEAIDAVTRLTGAPQVNAVGYCLGGTLLSIAAAAMARDGDERLASITLFAAQVDFTEPGELSLFIDESQLSLLESIMWEQGYLDTKQMAGAFQLLRSNDLIWSRRLNQYVLGHPEIQNDLAAWNADATRMPFRMHSEYLRHLFLANDLAAGRYEVDGRPIAISDIRVPFFCVGTLTDHVAPWRSVFKIHLLADAEITFLLTSGGHNAGVISPPGHARRSFQLATREAGTPYVDPDQWEAGAPQYEGSWWPAWEAWLAERSGPRVAPPAIKALCDAPGTYVMVP